LEKNLRAGAWKRIEQTRVLVLDEVSFVSGDLLCRRVRKQANTAFGGMRVIVVVDFCHLGPIGELEQKPKEPLTKKPTVNAFEAHVWKDADFVCYILTVCHRYCPGSMLSQVLQRCRTQGGQVFV
jgi:hypothetical protein